MVSTQSIKAQVATALVPLVTNGSVEPNLEQPLGNVTTMSDCVGPLAVPAELTCRVRALTDAAGVDDFAAFSIRASILVRRMSHDGVPWRARVILSWLETTTPMLPELVDPDQSFRAALGQASRCRVGAPSGTFRDHVCVTILLSQDNSRLYVESMTSSAEAPLALCWARSFLHLLTCLAAEPNAPMSAHPLVDDAERQWIFIHLDPHRTLKTTYRTITEPFERQVERTPNALALLEKDGNTLTCRELDEPANRLTHFLLARGVGAGTRVGICVSRGIGLVVAIYAAVKTGASYVPLDADLPDARLAYNLTYAAPSHVLTDSLCASRIPEGNWETHDVGQKPAPWHDCPDATPVTGGTCKALLYIPYASGSTGRPKGVAYPTSGALANIFWMQGKYPYGENDTALLKTSPGFDVSIWEIFWPPYNGARLPICHAGGHRDAQHLANLVEDYDVKAIHLAPTVMTPFLEQVSSLRAKSLRWALCRGEPVTPRIRDAFYATLQGATLSNCYGPTEAGSVTDMVLEPNPGAAVPLGRPAENFKLVLFNENLELVPVSMPGEAYPAGEVGVAYAFWRAPGRTAERFIPDPYGPAGARMYRTGDLCRCRDDGVLEHLGRVDRQVKIRGLRVEPGEIERVLAAHPAVADCAVVAHGDLARLLAFVVPADGAAAAELDAAAVAEYAAALLPRHMRPAHVTPVPRIPATVNGKIDKDALIAAWRGVTRSTREILPPADELETILAGLYSKVLDTALVGALDTFVDLGGHSLLAFKLLDECENTLRAKPDVAALPTGTIKEVAASLRDVSAKLGP